jgi:hypothetical protein
MWLWYILAIAYVGIIVLFAIVNVPTEDSPNQVKLITYWILIDYCLIVIMIAYYFKTYYAFKGKDKPFTKF